jgi:hypothetical protein
VPRHDTLSEQRVRAEARPTRVGARHIGNPDLAAAWGSEKQTSRAQWRGRWSSASPRLRGYARGLTGDARDRQIAIVLEVVGKHFGFGSKELRGPITP